MPGTHVQSNRPARLFAQVRLTVGLGVVASFSRACLIKVLDAIHNALHSVALAAIPTTLLLRKPAPRLNQELLLQCRCIELLPVRTLGNANYKLDLVLIPLIDAPKLPAG